MDHINQIHNHQQNSIRAASLSTALDESSGMPKAQLTLSAIETHNDIWLMQDFGFASSPTLNSGLVLLNRSSGHMGQSVAIGGHDSRYRPRNLSPGESCVYDSGGQTIYLRNGSTITITANEEIIVNATSSVTINCANVTINGTLTVTGDVIVGSNKISAISHKHGGVQVGGSTTTQPVP